MYITLTKRHSDEKLMFNLQRVILFAPDGDHAEAVVSDDYRIEVKESLEDIEKMLHSKNGLIV